MFAALPPDMMGLPSWAAQGLSIGSLVSLIVFGLATSRLYTKRQVDEATKQHEREVTNLVKQHDREVEDLKNRYETHITRTVQLLESRATDARSREVEWRDVAQKWQSVAEMLAAGIEPLQDQGETMLRLLQAWQSEASSRRAIGQ